MRDPRMMRENNLQEIPSGDDRPKGLKPEPAPPPPLRRLQAADEATDWEERMNEKLPKLKIFAGDSYAKSYVTLNGEKLTGVLRVSLDITPLGPVVTLAMEPDAMNLEIPEAFKALVKVDFIGVP